MNFVVSGCGVIVIYNWKCCECLLVGSWISNLYYVYIMKYFILNKG